MSIFDKKVMVSESLNFELRLIWKNDLTPEDPLNFLLTIPSRQNNNFL